MNPLAILSRGFREVHVQQVGIYILISDDKIVYVGQSRDVAARIIQHTKTDSKKFDRALWFELPIRDLLAYEGALIRLLRPIYNGGSCPAWCGRDNEVLLALGLTPHADEREHERDWERTRYRNPRDRRYGPRSRKHKAWLRQCRARRIQEARP